ncbi:hypothetical protein GGF46_003676 [Coemansia sp. RSA 552]|nr:hypothetical protein GGF46_003676 [Coemansia sp. RSA 552]
MAALSGKELDDSIFSTESHLDWADEMNMESLDSDPFPAAGERHDEGVGTSPRPREARGSRRQKDVKEAVRGRSQQPRQTRQGGRSQRGNAEAGQSARGGSRSRGPRSSSRTRTQPQQQAGGGARQGRGPQDRSASIERPGTTDRPRNWRGPTTGRGGARADAVDRWAHDKFAESPAQPSGARDRRNSAGAFGAATASAIDIKQIGKEGVSTVTINRRGSNASSLAGNMGASSLAGNMGASSFDQPRRLHGAPEPSGDPADSTKSSRKKRSGTYADMQSQQQTSPRSPDNAGSVPYRAPHRRQSSADSNPMLVPPAAKAPPAPAKPPAPAATKEDDGGTSSPEMEWENFVANGGLDIPFDSITDELLKQPRRPLAERQADVKPVSVHDRTESLLNDDNDEDDDLSPSPGIADGRGSSTRRRSKQREQGISIRGSAKREAKAAAASQAPKQPPQASASSKGGIQIKDTSTNGSTTPKKPATKTPTAPANASAPSRSRPATPPKPSTPPLQPLSRSSSGEGAPRSQGTVPSSYPRRQHEVYDEERGRHVFSANIPYAENRYAPIHVHEKDDVAKLAAKFARVWRVHSKELHIKRMLTKMRVVMQECPL